MWSTNKVDVLVVVNVSSTEWIDLIGNAISVCLSFNFWKQYRSDGMCLTSVDMQKHVTSL